MQLGFSTSLYTDAAISKLKLDGKGLKELKAMKSQSKFRSFINFASLILAKIMYRCTQGCTQIHNLPLCTVLCNSLISLY